MDGIGNRECKNYLQLNMCKETESGLLHEVLKFADNFESVMGQPERARKPYNETANAVHQNQIISLRPNTEMNHEGSIHIIGLIMIEGVYQKSFASVVAMRVI